jgi:hypothetical protein
VDVDGDGDGDVDVGESGNAIAYQIPN